MVASTYREVPTVGWIGLKRTHAIRPYSGYGYRGPACCKRILWFGCEANDLRNVKVTLPLTIRLITIRATDEPGTYDARASICTGISSKLHCSAVSLVPMPLVSPQSASSYTSTGTPPIPLYYLPPPLLLQLLSSSFSSFPSLRDLSYHSPSTPHLLLSILPLTRYTSH